MALFAPLIVARREGGAIAYGGLFLLTNKIIIFTFTHFPLEYIFSTSNY